MASVNREMINRKKGIIVSSRENRDVILAHTFFNTTLSRDPVYLMYPCSSRKSRTIWAPSAGETVLVSTVTSGSTGG